MNPAFGHNLCPGRLEDGTLTHDLVSRAASGNPESQEQLFSILIPLFLRQARRACERADVRADSETVEDLAAEVVLHFMEDVDEPCRRMRIWLADPRAPFEHYAAAVASNKLRSLMRSLVRRREREIEPLSETIGGIVQDERDGSNRSDLINACLEKLPPDYCRVLALRYGEGRSSKEVAAKMRLSRGAVYQLTHKAKNELRRLVAEETEDETP